MNRKRLKDRFKIFIAAHHYVFISRDIQAVAKAANVFQKRIEKWMKTREWRLCLRFWDIHAPFMINKDVGEDIGDLSFAKHVWESLIKYDEIANPSEYPDNYLVSDKVYSDPHDVIPITNAREMYQHKPSRLIVEPFCVENLHTDQIENRITEERDFGYTPCRYGEQLLIGYHWWLFPNFDNGIFSKVFARSNVFGNLLCGAGDKTHLVCIENGRFVLSQSVSNNAVLITDKRLLVCL